MNLDEFYKLLGYGLVCLFVVYIVAKSVRFQLGVVEGLVNYTKPGKKEAAEAESESESEN